jgi:hypothetical protein
VSCEGRPLGLYAKYYEDDQIKEVEMGGACSMHKRLEINTRHLTTNLKGRHHLECICWRIILQLILNSLEMWIRLTYLGTRSSGGIL